MVDASDGLRHGDVRICDFSSDPAYSLHTMPHSLAFHRMVWGWDSNVIADDYRKVFVMSPEERQSDHPTRMTILSSICETELEEVSGHERDQRRTRRQVLILRPLQNQRGRIGKRLWTDGRSHKGHKDATNK